MSKTTIGVKVDEDFKQRLKALAAARSRSPHWIVKTAVSEYLAREEAVELEREQDTARWERYELTGEAVSHSEVSEWLTALSKGKDAKCPG